MPTLRLAYCAIFLLALIAVFAVWSQVGGQDHLDLMPWYAKLGLGLGAAFAIVKAASASVSHKEPWNATTLRWCGILLTIILVCALATYYTHIYYESDEEGEEEAEPGVSLVVPAPELHFAQIA